jgi:DNA-binding NtrC family response regulator
MFSNGVKEKLRVLVVDDEDVLRLLVGMSIESVGLEMIEAEDGDSALKIIRSQDIAFVVTDLIMPGMTGLDFAAILKKESPATPATDVILLTGFLSQDSEQKAKEIGIFQIIEKPYDYSALEEAVRTAMDRAQKRKAA